MPENSPSGEHSAWRIFRRNMEREGWPHKELLNLTNGFGENAKAWINGDGKLNVNGPLSGLYFDRDPALKLAAWIKKVYAPKGAIEMPENSPSGEHSAWRIFRRNIREKGWSRKEPLNLVDGFGENAKAWIDKDEKLNVSGIFSGLYLDRGPALKLAAWIKKVYST